MDAHLFRLFCQFAKPVLSEAWIEKIQEPRPGLLSLFLFAKGGKRQLILAHGKPRPFCFFSNTRLNAPGHPPAPVMRLRKYATGKRIRSVVCQYCQRKIWLLIGGEASLLHVEQKATWLCLDLARGAQLYFLAADDIPQEDQPLWPQADNLEDALVNWQNWPVLTPTLRKSLLQLPNEEQMALLCDLEVGGGDVFTYYDEEQKIKQISAWPLPAKLRVGFDEKNTDQALQAITQAGESFILAPLFAKSLQELAEPGQRRQRQINKILQKLQEDESRLLKMQAREADALLIKANLWQIDSSRHLEMLELPANDSLLHVEQEGVNASRKIVLDRRFSILENMERFFRQAAKGKRGLEILVKRRVELLRELDRLNTAPIASHSTTCSTCNRPNLNMVASTMPRHVQGFVSSDNYLLMRGKDVAGNAAIRRMAKPHDLWAHVKDGQGSHVIIRNPDPAHEIPPRTLDEAGILAANKSWLAQSETAEIMYAQVRHVKPIRGAVAGKVSIDRLAMTRVVRLDPELEKRLNQK